MSKRNEKYDEELEGKEDFSKKSKYNKSKGKKNGNSSKRKPKDEPKDNSKIYKNDAALYIKDEGLRSQAGNYPFNTFLGLADEFEVGSLKLSKRIANSLAVRVNPSLGKTAQVRGGSTFISASAINATSRVWYNYISANTGRSANYSPDDIAIIFGAMSELVSTIAQAFRVYGLAFNINMRNRAVPKTLLAMCGCDPDSVLDNLATFRMRLNTLLIQANSLPIPADISIFQKNWNLFSNVFMDETSSMGQHFAFSEFSTWILEERTTPMDTGSKLVTIYLDDSVKSGQKAERYMFTGTSLLNVIEKQIHALQLASTYNMVYADIIQYLNKVGGKFYQFGYLPELYALAPQWNEEALSQLHNLTVMGQPLTELPTTTPDWATPGNDVIADVTEACVHFNPVFQHQAKYNFEPLLDIPFNDHPTPDDIINFTRYMSARDVISADGYTDDRYTITDKYVVCVLPLSDNNLDFTQSEFNYDEPALSESYSQFDYISEWITFRHHPTFYVWSTNNFVFLQELNYFTHLNYAFLDRLNDLSMYGLFQCPYVK